MTREEALKQWLPIVVMGVREMPEVKEAVNMVIKALEQETCDDCISREDALQALCKAVHKNDDTIPCPNQRVSCLWSKTKVQDYAEEILKLPPVTPQPKMGKWIYRKEEDSYRCSLCTFPCHKDNLGAIPTKYCAGCGAKMLEIPTGSERSEE